MEHREALEYCNTIKWKLSTCTQGEECWCRIVEPVEEVKDSEGNEIYIIGSGSVMKESAEHIVKVHNLYIESLK